MEHEQLKSALLSGSPLGASDIEQMAEALAEFAEHSIYDEDYRRAVREIDLLFVCFDRLPSSTVVQQALCAAALFYIDAISAYGNLAEAMTCAGRLKRLGENLPYDEGKLFIRTYANSLVLNIRDFGKGGDLYSELEKLTQKYAKDPIMPAMLAWVKLNHTNFNDLAGYFVEHKENVLVAGLYARACAERFDECLSAGDYDVAYGQMLPELERLLRDYGAKYRAYGNTLDYNFSCYWPNWLDHYFSNAFAAAAVDDVENDDLQSLLEHYAIFMRMDFPSETAEVYQTTEQQMLSNLAQLHGRKGDYIKAKEAIDRLRKYAEADTDRDKGAISALTDAIYNLVSQCAIADVTRYGKQLKAMAGELEAIAARTDDTHDHSRYAMALWNISTELEKKGIEHMPMWDLLYNYSMAHTVNTDMAENIADEEMTLTGSSKSLQEALMHRGRVNAMYEHEIYGENMTEYLAATDYNLLIVALRHGEISLAEEMLLNLLTMADQYAEDEETYKKIVLRIAKGAIMLATKYGDMNALESEFTVYSMTAERLIPFADDPEISQRLSKMALNLCIDLVDAKHGAKAQKIYEELKRLPFDQEAAERMKKIEKLLR